MIFVLLFIWQINKVQPNVWFSAPETLKTVVPQGITWFRIDSIGNVDSTGNDFVHDSIKVVKIKDNKPIKNDKKKQEVMFIIRRVRRVE